MGLEQETSELTVFIRSEQCMGDTVLVDETSWREN